MKPENLPPGSADPAPDGAFLLPAGDAERLDVVASFALDRLEDDPELVAITEFAAKLCKVPVALVTVVEQTRQRFLAREGIEDRETPRDVSFCAHAMGSGKVMIVPDATADARFADNALVTGPMGLRFYAGHPLVSEEGAPLGALCVIDNDKREGGLDDFQREGLAVLAQAVMRRLESLRHDIRAQRAIAERDERMRRMIENVPQIAWSLDSAGNFDCFNQRWKEVTGAQPPRTSEEWRPFIHPEDATEVFDKWYTSLAEEFPFEHEFRLLQADGSWGWVLAQAAPVTDKEGTSFHWFGTLTDIDAVHRANEARDLIAGELSHRIKNIFAVVIGLARLKAAKSPENQPFAEDLAEVLYALNRAHDFVRPASGSGHERLHGLLGAICAPYRDGNGQPRVTITGGDEMISARAATPLALVFHELATNSAKYGALSVATGTVSLTITEGKGEGDLLLEWREIGGPELSAAPQATGFGSRLIDMSVKGQLQGSWERHYDPTGLYARLTVAKAAIAP